MPVPLRFPDSSLAAASLLPAREVILSAAPSPEAVTELRELYEQHLGHTLTEREANEVAQQLLPLLLCGLLSPSNTTQRQENLEATDFSATFL